ncbi:MAG: MBL fold metallo-hydrolase [Desulfobacula sp.]|nr:MBL fold metallo-hydrolase [Desulfobacula sp.]
MKTDLSIHCLNVGDFAVNTYIVACPETREGVIIDPGGEDEKIIRVINDNKILPRYIINTHGHRDHVHGNASLSRHYRISTAMHVADQAFYKEKNLAIDIGLHDGDILTVGSLDIKVIHTPGHTPGSVCLYVGDCLFSGDTLFVGNAGRTDLPGGDLDTLIRSIQERIIVLPPETRLYPGHDYGPTPFSTLGREIKENIYITDFM